MCIFCDIATKKIPSRVVHEDQDFLAFHDAHPVAPTHVLVIPKQHITSLASVPAEHEGLIGGLLVTVRRVARDLGGLESGFRVVLNTGAYAGQSVAHIHAHILGGRPMAWPPG